VGGVVTGASTATFLPPTGAQHEIVAGSCRAVVTEVGATLRTLTIDGVDVVDGFEVEEMSSAGRGQLLAPWPNRLADGRYSFDGREAQAALDEPSRRNAIHGLVRWLPWEIVSRGDDSVELGCVLHPRPGYPWRLALRIGYEVVADGLRVTLAVENRSDWPAPFGTGFHPYVTLGGPIDDATLTIPAGRRLLTDDRGLPTADEPVSGTTFDFAAGRRIGTTQLDTAFLDLARGGDGLARAMLEDAETGRHVAVWVGPGFDYLMVYTGDTLEPASRRRRGVAIEPMSCPPNAFATGEAVIRLEPGGSWSGSWGITVGGNS
jgi:aldose 1-epimerase